MNLLLLKKLQSAIAPITADVSARMHANARVCTEMRAQNIEKCKTNPTRRKLTPRQLVCANLLVSGKTIAGAARELGVNECTIRRWKSHPHFAAEVRQLIELRRSSSAKSKPALRRNKPDDDEPLSPQIQKVYDQMLAERHARKYTLLHGYALGESSKLQNEPNRRMGQAIGNSTQRMPS